MSKETLLTGEKSLRQTIQQTGKVLFGQNVPNYTLYFLDPTKTKSSGEFMVIVNPYIELGRASTNVIQYGEEFATVSRKHASISFENGQVVVTSLGKNPTYVNGQEVQGKRFLQNGDEIQLSSNGPKLRFNSTVTNTSNMKFTQRMSLMAEQALKPYRRLVAALSLLLLLSIGAGLWYGINTNAELREAKSELLALNKSISDGEGKMREMEAKGLTQTQEYRALQGQVANQRQQLSTAQRKIIVLEKGKDIVEPPVGPKPPDNSGVVTFDDLPTDDVYHIYATQHEVALNGELDYVKAKSGPRWTGTAFLTNDSKLITARHVVQPYRFFRDVESLLENQVETKGGRIITTFKAINAKGDQFTFSSKNAYYDDSSDELIKLGFGNDSWTGKINVNNSSDWATIPIGNRVGKIKWSRDLSKTVPWGKKLYALGFSYGDFLQDNSKLEPLLSETMAAQKRLVNNVINTTNVGFGPGNSGGPVFMKDASGDWIVIGIVSASVESQVGVIVPCSNIR